MDDLGVDVDDTAEPSGLHPGQHRAPEQHWTLDEEVRLGEMVGPQHIGHLGFRLRAGGVEHQHVNGAETVGDRDYQLGNLLLVRDIGAKGVGDPAPRRPVRR